MLRIPHCLDNRLIDGGKFVGLTHPPHVTPQKHYYFNVSGTHFCYRLSKPQGLGRLEGLGKFKNSPHRLDKKDSNVISQAKFYFSFQNKERRLKVGSFVKKRASSCFSVPHTPTALPTTGAGSSVGKATAVRQRIRSSISGEGKITCNPTVGPRGSSILLLRRQSGKRTSV
jgi:hypothetical protein